MVSSKRSDESDMVLNLNAKTSSKLPTSSEESEILDAISASQATTRISAIHYLQSLDSKSDDIDHGDEIGHDLNVMLTLLITFSHQLSPSVYAKQSK